MDEPSSLQLMAIGQATSDSEAPPPCVPTQFVIGTSITQAPLVGIQEILGHLTLLHAFAELKNTVDAVGTPTILDVTLNKEQRWSWFIGCAVERFDIWCHALESTTAMIDSEIIMPPLDVIMVWHAYMLNPRWYVEDSMQRSACGNLRLLERQFSECLNGKFLRLLHQPPSQSRIDLWCGMTSQPFEYSVDGVDAIKQKSVKCHYCRRAVFVDLINPSGTGYLQESFAFDCPNSHIFTTITHGTLAVRKLANDLAGPGLSGSVFTTTPNDITLADAMKTAVISQVNDFGDVQKYEVGSPEYVDALSAAILQSAQFSMDLLTNRMGITSNRTRLNRRIRTAYFNEQVYSIELVGAVLRQGSFVRKMYDLGWTRPGYFDAEIDRLALHHASARYHAFLDLMSSLLSSSFVPTLDIDLVWHTHQLMPSQYQRDCKLYVGRFIDHDDSVETSLLSSEFDSTCRAWKSRFQVNYTHCGCPIPGDSNIGSRLSWLVGMYKPPPSHRVVVGDIRKQPHKEVETQTLESGQRRHSSDVLSQYFDGAFLVAVPMNISVGGNCVTGSGCRNGASDGARCCGSNCNEPSNCASCNAGCRACSGGG